MMRLWYRFYNARSVQRLYSQQDFEMMFGAEVMRRGRSARCIRPDSSQLRQSQGEIDGG